MSFCTSKRERLGEEQRQALWQLRRADLFGIF